MNITQKTLKKLLETLGDYDQNPMYGEVINFASNTSNTKDINIAKQEAFHYGFRMGWQALYHEILSRISKLSV